MLNSVLGEGLAGMQQSQKKMQQAAEDIVKAGKPPDSSVNNRAGGPAPVTENGTAAGALPGQQAVNAATQSSDGSTLRKGNEGDVVGALLEQRRQQHLFDASANVVSAANQTMGSLIDDLS